MSKTLAQHVVELLKAYLTIAVSVQLGKERIHVTLAAFKANTPDASPEFITGTLTRNFLRRNAPHVVALLRA